MATRLASMVIGEGGRERLGVDLRARTIETLYLVGLGRNLGF